MGLLAAALYLGFFATYRYGRPVLPSSTESLFLFGVCAFVIARESSWRAHPAWLAAGAGLLMTPALLVKSFVLAAPVGLWLFIALWVTNKASTLRFWHSAWPSTLAVVIGLAGFALWFALDPHPAAVWREFIVGENFSTKFSESHSDSVLSILLAPLLNAGLLAPLVLGLCWTAGKEAVQAWRNKSFGDILASEKLLWLWVLAWLVVFSIPSQRSARYVIPVMPAVAVLLALYAPRISRIWWLLTLALIALATAALGWIAYALAQVVSYSPLYFVSIALVLVLCVVGLCGAGLCLHRYRILLTATCAVAWLALLGALAAPFDGAAGRYDAAIQSKLAGQKILVPQNFNAQFERYTFILPLSLIHI
jgi:4-amino-4-deoxy-L-arabinose transferase-like glycosyltransferase